ncbi:MAG TPA: AMP-binding protein, partial [Lautropia sp.]|nr:AMP-binding protein [Lautropia sp.]
MLGQMMDMPLLVSSILRHAARHFGETEVVSRRVEGDLHRYSYARCEERARQLASALEGAGIRVGDRVASIAWNGYRHLELYYGVGGMGAVIHTINPRLHPEQIAWILNHAEDRIVAFDATFLPIVEAIASKCPHVRLWLAMVDADRQPAGGKVEGLANYETFLEGGDTDWR